MKLRPHPVFSEILSLTAAGDDYEWREIARWIKFEENVEPGGNRWSKPFVSTLLLKSVFELRQLLSNAYVQLDLQANNFRNLVTVLTQKMTDDGVVSEQLADKLQELLLKPRRHQFEQNKRRFVNPPRSKAHKGTDTTKTKPMQDIRDNIRFMRKIPTDAEAHNILIGQTSIINSPLMIFVRMQNSCIMDNLTEVPVPTRFVSILLFPEMSIYNFHEVGRDMATLMSDEMFRQTVYGADTAAELLNGIDEFLNIAVILPPRIWNPSTRIEPPEVLPSLDTSLNPVSATVMNDENKQSSEENYDENTGLIRTGRCFGGLINDIKRKAPWYWSDFRDGFSIQCIASITFLYFACLSPIITFGGLLSHATGKNMAAMESLVSGFVCGAVYGLFSGQPLTILGSTGPVLVFESIIYEFCQQQTWDYLTFRFWIGTWIAVILLMLTAMDASVLVRYITRFTEENFATLIALIFIFKAIENVAEIRIKYPISQISTCSCNLTEDSKSNTSQLNHNYCVIEDSTVYCSLPSDTSNVFLMSLLLFLGTFLIATVLKSFRSTLFFSHNIRQYISDFSVIIAIVGMSLIDFAMQINTPKLEVPKDFKPTLPTRNWIIPIFHDNNPLWTTIAAVIPALLGTILIFMDQQITAVIVNRKENKLRKGCGYHLDLFILAILIQICSIMGLPWFVAATVLSINHVKSLRQESECSAPGEKPQFLGVREQRITHIVTFSIIGLSVFLVPVLRHIPMPVLFGVFLYMGITSLNGLELFDRFLIMFMPQKYQPDYSFLRKVPISRVHIFTGIQLLCLAVLWLIKSFSISSIFFPLMLIIMIAIRKGLNSIFSQQELEALDDIIPESKENEPNTNKAVPKLQSETCYTVNPEKWSSLPEDHAIHAGNGFINNQNVQNSYM